MRRTPAISKFLRLRTLLVVGVLLSLCVSNNVGVSFLPLSQTANSSLASEQNRPADIFSTPKPPVDAANFRVPIMSQKRAEKEPEPQPVGPSMEAGLCSQKDSGITYQDSYSSLP